MATRDTNRRHVRPERPADEENTGAESQPSSATSARDQVDEVVQSSEDILDDIDDALRESLGLTRQDSAEEYKRRAKAMTDQFVQKGGE
jgi:hypothetical protein